MWGPHYCTLKEPRLAWGFMSYKELQNFLIGRSCLSHNWQPRYASECPLAGWKHGRMCCLMWKWPHFQALRFKTLGEDSKDSPGFSHLQAPCVFNAATDVLLSLSGKTYQWKSSSWCVLTKMSLLLQNSLCHIWYKYLKPNHFLMRYHGRCFIPFLVNL